MSINYVDYYSKMSINSMTNVGLVDILTTYIIIQIITFLINAQILKRFYINIKMNRTICKILQKYYKIIILEYEYL